MQECLRDLRQGSVHADRIEENGVHERSALEAAQLHGIELAWDAACRSRVQLHEEEVDGHDIFEEHWLLTSCRPTPSRKRGDALRRARQIPRKSALSERSRSCLMIYRTPRMMQWAEPHACMHSSGRPVSGRGRKSGAASCCVALPRPARRCRFANAQISTGVDGTVFRTFGAYV